MREDAKERDPVKVLLVDDREENLLALEAILSNPEYQLKKASSGREALKLVLENDFAVILLDVRMPDLDGFEVARLLKQRPRSQHIPLLFLTAHYSTDQDISFGYSLGAFDYLQTPLEPAIVRAKVKALVTLFEQHQEMLRQAKKLHEKDQAYVAELARQSQRRYRNLADAISHIVFTATPQGEVDYLNQRWFEYTGLPLEQALGWGWLAVVHPEEQETCRHAWQEAQGQGTPHQMECRLRRAKDGAYRWHLCRALAENDEHGARLAWLGTYTEIEELKRAQTAVEAAHDRTQFLSEASATLAASLDYATTLKQVARLAVPKLGDGCLIDILESQDVLRQMAAAYTSPEKEVLAQELSERLPFDPSAPFGVAKVLRTGTKEIYPALEETQWLDAALGAEHPELLRQLGARSYLIVPLQAQGRTLGTLTFVFGESGHRYGAAELALAEALGSRAALAVENARLYQEAKEAISLREEFLSIASHELKTPLTSLRLQLQNLLRRLPSGPQESVPVQTVASRLEKATQQSDRLAKLIEALLDASRLVAGKLPLERETTDLSLVVRAAAEQLSLEAQRAGSSLEISTPGSVLGFWDRFHLEQAVVNLLSNAIKYGEGKPVQVHVEAFPLSARLTVKDEGIGIPKDSLERIFAPFERAVSSQDYGGVGLGLYITRKIILEHGGSIKVQSQPGKGSTFQVELPRTVQTSPREEALP